MSKTQLQSNNARLASLIDELKGKATGGGGSAETCTVTINYKYGAPNNAFYVYTSVENGDIVGRYIQYDGKVTPVILENVVKGTNVVAVGLGAYDPATAPTTDGCEKLGTLTAGTRTFAFKITDNATITIENFY